MNELSKKRVISHWVPGVPTTDGAGVKLTRMIGTQQLDMVDPFLMLDRMDSDDPDSYIAGFPNHPHRGFETVTIMLDGVMRHNDSVGNEGVLGPGDVQWMTAGKGIIHSEIPEMVEGRLRGFQLWVNLPSDQKMIEPRYQDIQAGDIPKVEVPGGSARVIAGVYEGATGPAVPKIEARLLDVTLDAGAAWTIDTTPSAQIFMCVYEGAVTGHDSLGREQEINAPAVVLFHGQGEIEITAGETGASILYAEGEPLNEPISRMGPFVMNTYEEIKQAVDDYNSGRLTD